MFVQCAHTGPGPCFCKVLRHIGNKISFFPGLRVRNGILIESVCVYVHTHTHVYIYTRCEGNEKCVRVFEYMFDFLFLFIIIITIFYIIYRFPASRYIILHTHGNHNGFFLNVFYFFRRFVGNSVYIYSYYLAVRISIKYRMIFT